MIENQCAASIHRTSPHAATIRESADLKYKSHYADIVAQPDIVCPFPHFHLLFNTVKVNSECSNHGTTQNPHVASLSSGQIGNHFCRETCALAAPHTATPAGVSLPGGRSSCPTVSGRIALPVSHRGKRPNLIAAGLVSPVRDRGALWITPGRNQGFSGPKPGLPDHQ